MNRLEKIYIKSVNHAMKEEQKGRQNNYSRWLSVAEKLYIRLVNYNTI